jgi:hypothetical protein
VDFEAESAGSMAAGVVFAVVEVDSMAVEASMVVVVLAAGMEGEEGIGKPRIC